mmetsp:Transcript_24269/g.51720  ORF Transcript_24269/g.51720 Transcript_24269/m.51720 type:complete len:518 (-) Transcript_24269:119-1672(-)
MADAAPSEKVAILVKAASDTSNIAAVSQGGTSHEGSSSSSDARASVTAAIPQEAKIEVPRAWLTMPWFEAKLERWQDQEKAPQITLELPAECDICEGARLLEARLRSKFDAPKRLKEVADSDAAWSILDWWNCTGGRTAPLSAALHIFHLTLLEDFAKEVAETLMVYRIPCSKSMATIGAELKIEVFEESFFAFGVDVPGIQQMVSEAEGYSCPHPFGKECPKCQGLKLLADRAIAGSPPSKKVVEILINTFLSCFYMNVPGRHIVSSSGQAARTPVLGQEKANSSRKWLAKNIEGVVRRRFEAMIEIVDALHSHFPLKQETVQVREINAQGHITRESQDPIKLDPSFVHTICALLSRCLNMLFVESACRPETSPAAVSVLRRCVEPLFSLTFRATPSDKIKCGPGICCPAFAVASLQVQLAFLEVLPRHHYGVFCNNVHLVHEGARHLFVSNTFKLSAADVQFLSTAPLPGLERQAPPRSSKYKRKIKADARAAGVEDDEAVREESDQPPEKRART